MPEFGVSKVTIVIVNWNTGKLLQQCLEAIARLPDRDLIAEVMVVDNHSSDDSFERAKKVAVGVPVLMAALPDNVGFAAANNFGIRRRRHKDTHVMLLNPDTEVHPGAIKAGLEEFQAHKKTGVAGIKILNVDGSVQSSVRGFPTYVILITYFLKIHPLFHEFLFMRNYLKADFDYTQRQRVDQVMGAAFFIRREVLEQIGLLDEHFWIWFEEVDYCKRVTEAGWDVVYVPTGSVMHYGGASFNQLVGLRKTVPFLNSGLRYAYKHLGLAVGLILTVIYWPLGVLVTIPASLIHRIKKRQNEDRL